MGGDVSDLSVLVHLFTDGFSESQRVLDILVGIGCTSCCYDDGAEAENTSPESFLKCNRFCLIQLQLHNIATDKSMFEYNPLIRQDKLGKTPFYIAIDSPKTPSPIKTYPRMLKNEDEKPLRISPGTRTVSGSINVHQ